jgi:hypothetical protein
MRQTQFYIVIIPHSKSLYNLIIGPGWLNELGSYITTHTSLSQIRRGFASSFVNYIKGCTRLTASSDEAYQLLAHDRLFSPSTPASSTTKTGRHAIANILLKVALSTINQSINRSKYRFWLPLWHLQTILEYYTVKPGHIRHMVAKYRLN